MDVLTAIYKEYLYGRCRKSAGSTVLLDNLIKFDMISLFTPSYMTQSSKDKSLANEEIQLFHYFM